MNVDLLDYQYEFITSNVGNLVLTAGVGCGKTLAGAYFVLRMVSEFPKTDGLIVANTFAQLNNATLNVLFEVCDELGISYEKSLSRKQIKIMNTTIYCYSLENYDNIRGIEVGWIYADEFFLNKSKAAYDVIKTRLRCNKGPLFFRGTTTKNGFNWGYDLYDSPSSSSEFNTIGAKTEDNSFLPEKFVKDLENDYGSKDNPLYKQEVLNEYVNLTAGCIYWSFDRKQHVKPVVLNPAHHTYLGTDFNIDAINAVFVQYVNGIFYVGKEICLDETNANTFRLAEELSKETMSLPHRSIVPDSTGKARKTSSQKSDHEILKDAGFRLEVTTNPLIRDRQNSVNRAIAAGKVIIDPSCTHIIKELETLSSRDKEGEVAHISVALGYVIWKLDPLKKKQGRSETISW